jgi:eukaryotic-like serine/threonine-protein kinase
VIGERYVLEKSIGEGGMGAVWAGRQVRTRMAVALKFVRESGSAKPEIRRRLLREARAACAVQHPNVVQIHDFIELEDGAPVIVMELLVGESLGQLLAREGRLSLEEAGAILSRVVSAVGAAHEVGIVHRDLKPDNIFLATTPTGIEVKVLDFGIAKLTATEGAVEETGGLTNTGAMLGTPHYMSPEQAFGESDIDHRADIWALGVILFRTLSGELPTKGDNLGQILRSIVTRSIPSLRQALPDAPDDVVELVDRMLCPERAERLSDLREVHSLLVRHGGQSALAFGQASPAEPRSVAAASQDTRSRRSRWPALAAGAILIGGAAGVALLRHQAEPAAAEDPDLAAAEIPSTPSPEIEPQARTELTTPSKPVAAPGTSDRPAAAVPAPPPAVPSKPAAPAPEPHASAEAVLEAAPTSSAQVQPPAPELGGIVEETPF